MPSLRLLLCFALLSSVASAWSFDEWAANELLPRTRDLVRRHMVGARMFLTEPKKEIDLPEGEVKEELKKEEKSIESSNSSSSSSSSSSSEEKKVHTKKEEIVAVTTQQPTSSSSSSSPSASSASSAPSSSPSTTAASSLEKKTSEEEMAGKIVDVAEVLRKIAEKKERNTDKSIAEVKLEKKLEKLPLVKETKVEGGVTVEKLRKTSSPSSVVPTNAPVTKPVAQYRRVSCDMCLKAFQGLNYNVVQMKKVAEDMVQKDCEALLYGDDEAIGACVEVMLRKIDEYYNKFEPMIQTNKACIRLGMCAAHLVTNQVPQ